MSILDHADEITVAIRRVDTPMPNEDARETYYANFSPEVTVLNGEDIRTELFGIVLAVEPRDGIRLEERRSTLEWGSSASGWHYLVDLAASLDEELLGAAIVTALSRINKKVKAWRSSEPIDRDRALHNAEQTLLINTPSLARTDLTLHSEEEDRSAGTWSFTFRPGDGYEYEATVGAIGEMPNVTRVRRTTL